MGISPVIISICFAMHIRDSIVSQDAALLFRVHPYLVAVSLFTETKTRSDPSLVRGITAGKSATIATAAGAIALIAYFEREKERLRLFADPRHVKRKSSR